MRNISIQFFREGWRVGVRMLHLDDQRGCEAGAAISLRIGIGLFAPEIRVALMRRQFATERRRAHTAAEAADVENIPF